MKIKFVIVLIILSIYSLPSKSQLIRSYGIKGGLSLANQNWQLTDHSSLFDQTKVRQGYDIGFYVEWFNVPLISVLTEVHYIQKGMKWNINIPITTVDHPNGTGLFMSASGENWADYLSIPLLAKVRYSFPIFSTYLFAGPRFDYFIKNHSGIILSNFNKWDFGGTIGLGFEINSILPFNLGAEIRYSPNIQNSYSTQYLTVQNSSMEFLIVVGF
jgi:hypothetical protein